jgi:hypothetical protein
LKNILGIHHRARFKVVLNIMKVKKHKVFGLRQCTENSLTEKILNSLSLINSNTQLFNMSYISQLSIVVGTKVLGHTNIQEILSQISEKYACFDEELKEQVKEVMNSYLCIKELNNMYLEINPSQEQ